MSLNHCKVGPATDSDPSWEIPEGQRYSKIVEFLECKSPRPPFERPPPVADVLRGYAPGHAWDALHPTTTADALLAAQFANAVSHRLAALTYLSALRSRGPQEPVKDTVRVNFPSSDGAGRIVAKRNGALAGARTRARNVERGEGTV